jgi:hypothetical protein
MEEIAKKKVDALRVYYFLQTVESDLSLYGFDVAKKTFDEFVGDDLNLIRFFCYFTDINQNKFIPRKVGINMPYFVTSEIVSRFIKRVPTCLLKQTGTYLEGPCNLACMLGTMFRNQQGLSWYTWYPNNKDHDSMKKSINYVKIKFPREDLDLGE